MMDGGRVLIVGAGMSGLACARVLNDAGVPAMIFEASDRVGVRVGSECVDGYTLDRGFQIFLTEYPEAKRFLDYDALNLRAFKPGALVRHGGRFHRFVDPRRRPSELISTIFSPLATLGDKVRVPFAAGKLLAGDLPHVPTIDRLRDLGFSDRIIERFFRPFFAGVFLDADLATSSRMFDFTLLQFAAGDAALPATGMQAIGEQMAQRCVKTDIVTGCRVEHIEQTTIRFNGVHRESGSAVVIATDANTAARLLTDVFVPREQNWTASTTIYYAAERSPVNEPILVLNADDPGPVNHLAVITDVSPGYAPTGKALVACAVIGAQVGCEITVREQMVRWYGHAAHAWRHLKTCSIPHALPDKSIAAMADVHRSPRAGPGVYLCGDYCDMASINGAMCSGRRAAEAILADRA